jgi:hypothetical protein
MSLLVEVRPLERKSWHGKTGAESFTRPKKFQVLCDEATMKYAHGLSPDDIKMLKTKFKVPYDLSDDYDTENPHPFWDSSLCTFKLENNTMFFDTSLALNFIKVKAMKASKFVANSLEEWEEGLWPDATHVIYDEAEVAQIKASIVATEDEAIIAASKLTKDKKIELLFILAGKNMKGQSDDFVNVALSEFIKKRPVPGEKGESGAAQFLRLINEDKTETANQALVMEALEKNVLRRDGHRIYYMDAPLGNDEVEVAKYLSDDDNQDLKIIIQSKVNLP